MMTYFVISDIHGFYEEMIDGLRKAGYNKKNKNHFLIVLGDIFDRGPQPIKVYKYLKSIPKSRIILIKGNHESLYFELLTKKFPDVWDFNNRTVKTFCNISGIPEDLLNEDVYGYNEENYKKGSTKAWKDIVDKVKKSEITSWLKSSQWKNYYELDKFIFVHSFIPEKNNNWRSATDDQWEDATWGCPWEQYKNGLFDNEAANGKVLVCGHWHTNDFYKNLNNDLSHSYSHDIYYSKNLIGIDGGVFYNRFYCQWHHPQNVLVIQNSECFSYDENTKKLEKLKC